jgi:hypothetical protein
MACRRHSAEAAVAAELLTRVRVELPAVAWLREREQLLAAALDAYLADRRAVPGWLTCGS